MDRRDFAARAAPGRGTFPPPMVGAPNPFPMAPGVPMPNMPFMPPHGTNYAPGFAPSIPLHAAAYGRGASISVWIGKIGTGVSDRNIHVLLDCISGGTTWKRQVDTKAGGVPKTFGFAEFSTPLGALLAKSLLNELSLGDSKLLVKIDEKNQKLIDEWSAQNAQQVPNDAEKSKLRSRLLSIALEVNTSLGISPPTSTSSSNTIANNEPTTASTNPAHAAENTSSPADPTAPSTATNAPSEPTSHVAKKISSLEAKREEERRRDLERKLELIEEDKEAERRRLERNEKTYKSVERLLENEQNERKAREERRKKLDESDLAARADALVLENALLWTSANNMEQKELALRKALLAPDRVKLRMREKELDESDRKEEEAELRAEMRRAEERHKEQVKLQQEEQAQRLREHQQSLAASHSTAKDTSKIEKKRPHSISSTTQGASSPGPASKMAKLSDSHSSPHSSTIGTPTPQAVAPPTGTPTNAATAHAAPSTSNMSATLASKIPSDLASLFAAPIRWDLLEKHDLLEKKIRPWVIKKIVEYLEVEENTMIQFICTHVKERRPAKDLIAQLSPVLDDETEVFVITLWRMLLLESLKLEAGQQ